MDSAGKLLSLIAIAFCWAHLIGEWLHGSGAQRLRVKAHGRRAKSFFRHGLDYLRYVLNHVQLKYADFTTCITVISTCPGPNPRACPNEHISLLV